MKHISVEVASCMPRVKLPRSNVAFSKMTHDQTFNDQMWPSQEYPLGLFRSVQMTIYSDVSELSSLQYKSWVLQTSFFFSESFHRFMATEINVQEYKWLTWQDKINRWIKELKSSGKETNFFKHSSPSLVSEWWNIPTKRESTLAKVWPLKNVNNVIHSYLKTFLCCI